MLCRSVNVCRTQYGENHGVKLAYTISLQRDTRKLHFTTRLFKLFINCMFYVATDKLFNFQSQVNYFWSGCHDSNIVNFWKHS